VALVDSALAETVAAGTEVAVDAVAVAADAAVPRATRRSGSP